MEKNWPIMAKIFFEGVYTHMFYQIQYNVDRPCSGHKIFIFYEKSAKIAQIHQKIIIGSLFFTSFFVLQRFQSGNFWRFSQKFFGREKYLFSDQKPQIGQKFLFPAEFWRFEKFSNM